MKERSEYTTQHNNTKAICSFEKRTTTATTTVPYVWKNKKQFNQMGYADSSQTLGSNDMCLCVWMNLYMLQLHLDELKNTDTKVPVCVVFLPSS